MARHDKDLLKSSLAIDDIKKLLYELGSNDISHNEVKNELITNTVCHNKSDGSHKLFYYVETQSFYCYTGCSCSMDIFELVRRNYSLRGIELSFTDTVNWVAEKTGNSFGFGFSVDIEDSGNNDEMEWLNRFTKRKHIEYPPLKEYSDRLLNVFEDYHDPSFLEDNISHEAMSKFDIKFYAKTNSVIVPHRGVNGKLLGVRSRNLNPWEVEAGYKYVPTKIQGVTYSFPTQQSLFGLYQNQSAVSKIGKIILFESEKSVMQTYSYFGENCYAVALSGSNISQYQVDLILNIEGISEVQIALDKEYKKIGDRLEKVQREKILRIGRRFSPYLKTTVLWDTESLLDYKDSPSDKGKETLLKLLRGKKEILNIE